MATVQGRVTSMPVDPATGQLRGFCFLRVDDGGAEYFLHRHEFNGRFDDLDVGDAVAFEPGDGPKGPRAFQARRVREEGNGSSAGMLVALEAHVRFLRGCVRGVGRRSTRRVGIR